MHRNRNIPLAQDETDYTWDSDSNRHRTINNAFFSSWGSVCWTNYHTNKRPKLQNAFNQSRMLVETEISVNFQRTKYPYISKYLGVYSACNPQTVQWVDMPALGSRLGAYCHHTSAYQTPTQFDQYR